MTKIAIIGCGKQAPKHINGLRKAYPNIEIIVADRNEQAAKALGEAQGVEWSNEPQDVLVDPTIDAIDICTPTSTHTRLILKALENGKDFFCEKPLCRTLEEAEQILSKMNETGRIGMVGYIYRFAPVFEAAYKAFEEKALGDIASAQFRIGGRGSHQLWKHLREKDGGAINEMLVHMLDLAVWYFGDVQNAEVLINDLRRPRRSIQGSEHDVDAEDYVLVRCKMADGTDVLLQADMVTPAFTQHVEIQGDNGTFMGSIQQDMPSFLFLQEPANDFKAGKTDLSTEQADLFGNQMSEFINAIKTRKQPSRCSVEDSIKVMRAIQNIKEKAA